MPKHVRVLTVFFDTEISIQEIPLFRGAVLGSLGERANLLYHNHTGVETFRYAYPLIQYKQLRGKAAMVCVEQGADIIGQFLTQMPDTIRLGQREIPLQVRKAVPARILVQTWQTAFTYHISRWLPLNAKNYLRYQAAEDQAERIVILEAILRGNLLSMLKGVGIFLESELQVSITDLSVPYPIYNKGVALMAFSANFTTNLSIPNFIGVGKNASIGCGVVFREWADKEQQTENRE